MDEYPPAVNIRPVDPVRSCADCWYTYRQCGNTYCVRQDGPIFYDHEGVDEKVCDGHATFREVYDG